VSRGENTSAVGQVLARLFGSIILHQLPEERIKPVKTMSSCIELPGSLGAYHAPEAPDKSGFSQAGSYKVGRRSICCVQTEF
jgi:hypothetical protein